MKYLMWLLKAAIFFTLFAFALNNQQLVSVFFFFGTVWKAPLVLVVLAAFACGLCLGVLVMIPRWWKKRKITGMTVSSYKKTAAKTATDKNPAPHHGI